MLNGYVIIKKTTTQLEKACSTVDDTTWLSASRHAVETHYTHASATAAPMLNITFSGPDTGNNEVCTDPALTCIEAGFSLLQFVAQTASHWF